MPHQGLSLSVDAFTDLESPTTVTEMISSYLDRPILSLAVKGTCGRSDRGIFEPLRGKFDLPIERVRWDQPVEPAR